jgi:DNA recombination protein RmuC
LQEKIHLFEKKVEDTHKASTTMQRQQILGLREMNVQMSKETINLTRALKEIVKCKVIGRISARRVLENQV